MAEPQQQQPTWTPQQIEAWRKRIRDARKGARSQAPGGHIWATPSGSHRTIQRRGQNIRVKQKPGQMMSTGGGWRSANPLLDSLHALRRGTDAPVRVGQMSWKGHGASPRRREARKLERQIRQARNEAKAQKAADLDADVHRVERGQFWDQADFLTRRGRTSRKGKEARRRGARPKERADVVSNEEWKRLEEEAGAFQPYETREREGFPAFPVT